MPHYKDQNNKLHYLDSSGFEYMLPAGCVPITDEEAAILSAPPPPTAQQQCDSIQAQIEALEHEHIMPRITRETLILIAVHDAAGNGMTEPQLYASNIGYRKLKDLDRQISDLRSKMTTLKGTIK